ncbi:hypothetical protein JT359_11900 [Candidatus Poribacteria bacterium]|nr:hypothetical protein [Candidatus Poribacteria bacterium]
MNCEQTREKLVIHRQESMFKGNEKQEFLEHLRSCESCQQEYEELLHTASILENLESPEPPPELLGNIQDQIRELHKKQNTAIFAAPFSWLFGMFKFNLSPKLVNSVAMVCYLLVSVFLVKVIFFGDTGKDDYAMTAMDVSRLPRIRFSTSHWGSMKHGINRTDDTRAMQSEGHTNLTDQFAGISVSELWHIRGANESTDTAIDGEFTDSIDNKLTLFWSDIKAKL